MICSSLSPAGAGWKAAAILCLLLTSGLHESPAAKIPVAARQTSAAVEKGLPNPSLRDLPKLALDKLPVTSDGKRIAARVNGQPIFADQLLQELELNLRNNGQLDSKQEAELYRQAAAQPVLDQLILQVLALDYARLDNILVLESDVDAYIEAENRKARPGAKLQDIAFRMGISIDVLRARVHDRIVMQKVKDRIGSYVAPPTDDELKKWLQTNANIVTTQTEIRVSHIAVPLRKTMTSGQVERARLKIETAQEKIKAGDDFVEVVRQFSEDRGTVGRGGDLGYLTRGRMYPEFDEAAFALQPGQVSGIVRTPVGFHIIKVTERRESNARDVYMTRKKAEAFAQWQAQARRSARVEIYL